MSRDRELLEYQPDAVEIEERPVPGKARWVLYLILTALIALVVGAIIFKVDRIVAAEGELITSEPTLVVQPLSTAVIRTIEAKVGDTVEKGQLLATLDPTFASADLSQLKKQSISLSAQVRRIEVELAGGTFTPRVEEGEDGVLQQQVLAQRRSILAHNKRTTQDKIAALRAKLELNTVQRQGHEQQHKLLRDVEGNSARRAAKEEASQHRARILDAQKARFQSQNAMESLDAEAEVTRNELRQAQSEWLRYVEEQRGELLEQQVKLRDELAKVMEELQKAQRMHDLIALRAPDAGIVLKVAERSVGSIIQQAEPFMTLVPMGSVLEAEVRIQAKDIGRIRFGDTARIKLDAFPFQRHDTLPGTVRIISENAFSRANPEQMLKPEQDKELADAFYRTRLRLLSTQLRNVPDGFRLIPGMKVRAEIKVGHRSVISYFLYPVIRALDEGLREP